MWDALGRFFGGSRLPSQEGALGAILSSFCEEAWCSATSDHPFWPLWLLGPLSSSPLHTPSGKSASCTAAESASLGPMRVKTVNRTAGSGRRRKSTMRGKRSSQNGSSDGVACIIIATVAPKSCLEKTPKNTTVWSSPVAFTPRAHQALRASEFK